MKNSENWKETKFVFKKGKLRANPNEKFVSVSSRLVANIVAKHYQDNSLSFFKGNFLDLGCGFAPLYSFYRNNVTSVTCADWEQSMHQNPHLDVICDLNVNLPFETELFDSILLSDVLEHIRKPEQLLKEIHRILRKDGVLIMNVPYYYCLHEEPHDYFRYTEFALKSMTTDAGLKLELLQRTGGTLEIMTDLFAKNIRPIPLIGKPLCQFSQFLTWQLLHVKPIRKLNLKTAAKFPLGYFLVAKKTD
jgi:SAM-dependent methyltransferase